MAESRKNSSDAVTMLAASSLATESKSDEVSTEETNKSLEESDSQIAETPKPKEKEVKKTNCTVPNYSTEDF